MKELKERLEELEEQRFMIDMIDHWTQDNKEMYDKLTQQIKEIKQQL